jgi:hypothetical protein
MNMVLRRLVFAILLLCPVAASADTAAGLAAYDKGDYERARSLLKPEAEKGDPAAQVRYGLLFAKGLGVPRDGAAAFKWFQKSAAQGNAEAMYCVGVAYDVGDAGSKDPAKALAWYRKSAEQGYAKGQFNLGQMLQSGDGVAADQEEALQWLEKAAAQNEDGAEASLGLAYVKGLGVEPNLLTARYWAERSAAHGSEYGKKFAEALHKDFAQIEAADHVPRTAGGDGSTLERAIRLPDQKTESTGVDAEYRVLHYFFPGYRKVSQALLTGPDNRPYDVLTVSKDGKQRDVYFEITNFFGNME